MVDRILDVLLSGFLNTLVLVGASVFPVVALCTLMLVVGRWTGQRLYSTFGWKGILALAWLGTPVHELSHLLACLIGRNEVTDFALFKPDKSTGSLGYVQHSYDRNSLYQRFIGNTLIAVAPFFGGALVIYLLTRHFYPTLLPGGSEASLLAWERMGSVAGLTDLLSSWWRYFSRFVTELASIDKFADWRFWIYVWAMISVAAHLAPSPADFEGFWGPALILLAVLFVGNIGLAALRVDAGVTLVQYVNGTVVSLNGLLVVALMFLLLGAALVWTITALYRALT
jgi:hypothetical protein